jgi:putative transposase
MIVLLSNTYPNLLIFNTLRVSKSSFYAWKRAETYRLKAEKARKSEQVKEVFTNHRRRYGARRISMDLKEKGIKIGRYQVRTFMKQQELVAIQPKSFVPKTTNSSHDLGRSPNLLLNADESYRKPTKPHEIYVGDITYIPLTDGDFLYLATFQDMYTRVIVGWELMDNMATPLVINALQKAIHRYSLPKGLIVHTDGGGQYAAHRFKQLLSAYDFLSSMTRRNNHYDNAMGESLFSRFKAEVLEKGTFERFEDAYTEIFEYIELYYNKKRRHSGILYDFPERFEKKFWENHKNAQL